MFRCAAIVPRSQRMAIHNVSSISYAFAITCRYSSSLSPSKRKKTKRQERRHRRRGQSWAERLGENEPKKIMFQSLGCPRNLVDTEVMLGLVLQAGLEPTQSPEEADYVVVNTCGFLQTARDESKEAIQQLLNEKKPTGKLLVTGCMVNLHKDQILSDYPEVDGVLGSGSVDKVLEAIEKMDNPIIEDEEASFDSLQSVEISKTPRNSSIPRAHTTEISDIRRSYLEQGDTPRFLATPPNYAYLKIAEGCRKRCSFCIIPKIKGRLQSKPVQQIVDEFVALLDTGHVSEVILIAQDLGDYGKDMQEFRPSVKHDKPNGLATLLRAMLDADDRDYWLRLLYLYPDEITPEIIDIIASDRRICRYLDMPIQHINDDILKLMKRRTTSGDIRRTMDMLRERLPDIHIRTSLMVGFPGETDEQFEELLDFVMEYQLENVGGFTYSNEPDAASFKLPNHVPEDVKQDRYDRLMTAQWHVTEERHKARVENRERLNVVVEGLHKERDDWIVGRYYGQCPDIDGQIIIDNIETIGKLPTPGRRYDVELTGYDRYDLIGKIVV